MLQAPNVVQVSLNIRRGYVPDKFSTANTKTGSLGMNLANLASPQNDIFPSLFAVFESANSKGRLYYPTKCQSHRNLI